MSIYTRSYMRPEDGYSSRPLNMVKWILITLAVAFILQNVVEVWIGGRAGAALLGAFSLNQANLSRGLIYTPITYALLHAGLLHVLFNGLGIFFVGRALQERLGPIKLLEVFLLAVIGGGLCWLLISTAMGRHYPLIGASAGVFGLLSLFALYYWNETVRFFFWFIPVSLRGKQIFLILLGLQLFFFLFNELAPHSSGRIAYSAHIAGFDMGYVYFRFLSHRQSLWETLRPKRAARTRKRDPRETATRQALGRFSVNLKTRPAPELRKEVDRILDKINTEGFGALSVEEKETLDRAKDTLR